MNVQRPKQPLSMCYYPLVATCTHGTCTGCLTPRAAHSRRRPRSSGPRPPSARPRSRRREAPQRPSAWSQRARTAAQAGCAIGQRRAPALTRLRGPARPPCARPYLSGVAIAPAKLNQCGRTKSFFNDLGLRRVQFAGWALRVKLNRSRPFWDHKCVGFAGEAKSKQAVLGP